MKGDLNKDGKMSSYESKRQAAIEKNTKKAAVTKITIAIPTSLLVIIKPLNSPIIPSCSLLTFSCIHVFTLPPLLIMESTTET